jgi:ABC-2 type transport system permease protein
MGRRVVLASGNPAKLREFSELLSASGLAVGLGALFPNFKEDNPSKIVSGFGGTFCLVLSFLYIVAAVTLLALGSPWSWSPQAGLPTTWIAATWTGFLLLSLGIGGRSER